MVAPRRKVIADTTAGRVRGTLGADGTMMHFRGIPYALPPVGDLRWRPPVPVPGWKGTLKATSYGPAAFQRTSEIDKLFSHMSAGLGLGWARRRALAMAASRLKVQQSEDCLTVNVHAPAHATDLPVMVWIHGGDHTDGRGSEDYYNSDGLPERGCVLVTFNYRLGLFGFFAHPELSEESPDGVSGNYGLLDQIAVLEWVRDNIAAFGGDPARVTIFGESAGGQAVLNLMTSPRSRGLFHLAIAQSPSDSGRWLHLRRAALDTAPTEQIGVEFAELAVGGSRNQLRRLRATAPEVLNEMYRVHPELGRAFSPVVDDVILPCTPMTAFSDTTQASVPLMIGYNADEGSLLAPFMHPAGAEFLAPATDGAVTAPELRATLERSYPSAQHVDRLMAAYPGLASLDDRAVVDHVGDHMFGVHVDHAARRHSAAGNPVYRYHFRAVPPSKKQTAGAFHAAELFYLFDASLPLIPKADDAHLLAREMADRWFAFAASGVPDSPGRQPWPVYDAGDPMHLVLDRPRSMVEPCPPHPGLDVMRERIEWLNEALRPPSAPTPTPGDPL
jgi:para-nitrobenzyl esterase